MGFEQLSQLMHRTSSINMTGHDAHGNRRSLLGFGHSMWGGARGATKVVVAVQAVARGHMLTQQSEEQPTAAAPRAKLLWWQVPLAQRFKPPAGAGSGRDHGASVAGDGWHLVAT